MENLGGIAGLSDAQLELAAAIVFRASPSKLAPYIVGAWFDALMLGSIVVMFEIWRQSQAEERKLTRFLMVYLTLVSIGISGYYLSHAIELFVTRYGTYKTFIEPKFYRIIFITHQFSRIPAVLWFAHRAFLVSGRSILFLVAIGLLLLTTLACVIGINLTTPNFLHPRKGLWYIFTILYCCAEVMTDGIITAVTFVGLLRSRTGWKTTDTIITRLLITLAETQLPPTIIAMIFGICFLCFPADTVNFYFQGVLKVHVVCLMAVVISRRKIAGRSLIDESYELPRSNLHISVETQTHIQESGPDKNVATRKHSMVDPSGHIRSINGRLFGQSDESELYDELHSKTSLV